MIIFKKDGTIIMQCDGIEMRLEPTRFAIATKDGVYVMDESGFTYFEGFAPEEVEGDE